MNYFAPGSLEDAYQALADAEAVCLAGGQSLIAAMNLRLAAPGSLVSLRKIAALRGVDVRPDGGLRIGAMTTHAELAAMAATAAGPDLVARAARLIAYPAVRSRGTIGGSVALADPAADYPVALQAADASIEIGGPRGSRTVKARAFFRGLFETDLQRGEIVLAIHVPPEHQAPVLPTRSSRLSRATSRSLRWPPSARTCSISRLAAVVRHRSS